MISGLRYNHILKKIRDLNETMMYMNKTLSMVELENSNLQIRI